MASSSVFAELVRDCKLDGSNFTVWKRKTMFLLTAENIEYVAMMDEPNEPAKEADDEEKESYREELKEWTKDNKRAKIFILGSMTDSLAGEYESEDVACVIMRRLEEDFGEVSLIKVLSLVNKFLTSKLTESGSVNEHLNKMCMLSEELKNAGYPFSEEVQVMVALNSLPHSWEQFKVSFCHSERSLNMCTLRHHLIMEQDRKSSQGKEKYSQSTELHLGEERRSRNKKNSGKDLRDKLNKKRQWSDHPKSKINKKNYKCHHCGELGHFRADCLSRKKQYNPNENQRKQQENKNENSSPDATSWGFLLLLYVFVQMTRLVVVSVMYPLLRSLGYGLDFKEATVIVWSGLRGAVSLSLSMSVKRASDAAQPFLAPEVGTMFVFFTGGIVFLTLILNGSTTQFLLHVLGMDKLSATKLRMLNYTRYELLNKALEAFGDLRDDEELGPADWVTVKKYITYLSNLEGEHVHPHADQHEHIQTMNLRDIRVRLLNGVQATYWRMLEEGRITQATANILMRSVDEAMDLVASGSLCDWNGLRSNVHLPSYYRFLSMSRLPQRFITYFTVKRLESGCYICAAFLRAHRIARRQLQDFLGDSEIARIVIDESNAVGEEARMFLEEVRCTFPQLLSVLKTRQVTYSVLTHLSEYVQNLQKTGLLEEKEMVHLDMLCRET